jgi:hypothetical protein
MRVLRAAEQIADISLKSISGQAFVKKFLEVQHPEYLEDLQAGRITQVSPKKRQARCLFHKKRFNQGCAHSNLEIHLSFLDFLNLLLLQYQQNLR